MDLSTQGKPLFDNRVVGFIDILGFTDIIERMDKDPPLFHLIRDALKRLDEQSLGFQKHRVELNNRQQECQNRGTALLAPNTDFQMTAFSDCYVLSETSPGFFIIPAIQALSSWFLENDILTRGAVVRGNAYHKERVLFGPAIIQAYYLESEVAKYPRILVTDDVYEEVGEHLNGLHKGKLLNRDVDGCWYVNLMEPPLSKWDALTAIEIDGKNSRSHLEKVRKVLGERVNRGQDKAKKISRKMGEISKLYWLVSQFNKVSSEEIPSIKVPRLLD